MDRFSNPDPVPGYWFGYGVPVPNSRLVATLCGDFSVTNSVTDPAPNSMSGSGLESDSEIRTAHSSNQ